MKTSIQRSKDDWSGTKAVVCAPSRQGSLSLKAKGILYYLLLRPDDWRGQLYDIALHSKDGKKSVRSGVKELVEAGYMKQIHIKVDGQFKGSYYEFSEKPKFK